MAKHNARNFFNSDVARYALSVLILGGAVLASVVMYLLRPTNAEVPSFSKDKIVEVVDAKAFDGNLTMYVSGVVEPHREIEIAAQVAGLVDQKESVCRAGTYVEPDVTLIKIDDKNYQLAVKRLLAEKKQAEASVSELKQELENLDQSIGLANEEFDLQKKDYERKKRAGSALSESELDQALRALTSAERSLTELSNTRRLAETRLTRLQTGIELSKVRLEEAEVNLQRCEIKAPFAGVIVQDPVEKGDYVAMGQTVAVLEDIDKIDVKCNLRLEQLAKLVKYQVPDSSYLLDPNRAYELPPTPVTIRRKRGNEDLTWEGTLVRYDGIGVDPTTKMIPCRIVVEDPISEQNGQPKALVRGMFVNVEVKLENVSDTQGELIEIPEIAIQPGDRVWTVDETQWITEETEESTIRRHVGKLKWHSVEVLERENQEAAPEERIAVIRSMEKSLNKDSQIVISPLMQPENGNQVVLETIIESSTSEDESKPVTNSKENTSSRKSEAGNAKKTQGAIRS